MKILFCLLTITFAALCSSEQNSNTDAYEKILDFYDKMYSIEPGLPDGENIVVNPYCQIALYYLQKACKQHECKVTHAHCIRLLHKNGLVDRSGNVAPGVCEALNRIEKDEVRLVRENRNGTYWDIAYKTSELYDDEPQK